MGVAAVIATDSIHDLVHMAINQLHSSYSGDVPTQQHTGHLHTVPAQNGKRILTNCRFPALSEEICRCHMCNLEQLSCGEGYFWACLLSVIGCLEALSDLLGHSSPVS